ncbi:hypothetical protein [Peribacillus acanthi]|uniref:hypothetical protein n=1 Tax=Peribacillus acanthi TaxID=2171554 RepID=UPI00130046D6|nr:hypothetical protein [Peribacillus acanthi]
MNTKWYCYRNPMTGDEVRRDEPMSLEEMQNTGLEFMRMYDWSVSEKERKCK